MFRTMRNDVHAVFNRDPAAHSTFEVLLAYPGCTPSGDITSRTGSGLTACCSLAG